MPVTGVCRIYVRDLTTSTTTIATVDAAGTFGRGGGKVVFQSLATDTNAHWDIYVAAPFVSPQGD